jgi:transcriptional regulator with XRE-family HTH domain/tetratricopeptide (TPR) repeat protein
VSDGFAPLLRRYRLRQRLTQEALAERAGISSRSIGDMERGRGRSPRPPTVERLAAALELTGDERTDFVNAGRLLFWANRTARSDQPSGSAASVRQLPTDVVDFVGRGDELAELDQILHPATARIRLAAISGPPGVGKSALAVHAAHRFAARFPDGQLHAVLGGENRMPTEPGDILALLLRMLGVDGAALPAGVDERAGLFRARLAGRRVLLVLDDAAGHHQVEPLLPPAGAAVIVTSRLPLTGLPGAATIDLPPLTDSAAVDLLCQVAGADRVLAERHAAGDLVAACGNLPLAVRVAAARLAARPHWKVGMLAERLMDERRRLDELRHGDLAVRPTLQVTYRALGPLSARAFALLGALSAVGVRTFPEWTVAALLDSPATAAAAAIEELLDARLLDPVGPDQAGQQRYRFHEVTRLYARECREAEIGDAEWTAAFTRAADGWLALARLARDGLQCERFHLDDLEVTALVTDPRAASVAAEHAVDWFEAEREALGALVPACAAARLVGLARGLAGCSADFYELRGYYDDWRRAMQTALASCRNTGDRNGEAAMLRGLGTCLVECDEFEAAQPALRAARELAEELGDPAGAAMARKDLGFMLGLTGRLSDAELELRAAAEALGRAGRDDVKAIAMTSLGFVLRQRGDIEGAVQSIQTALGIAQRDGDRFAEAYASRGLAGAHLAAGRVDEAEYAARQAAQLFQQIDDPIGAAQSLRVQGEALARDPHRLVEAERAFEAAANVFRSRGHGWGLALVELSLGETEVRRGAAGAEERLRRALRFWTDEDVPALRARTLVALAAAAERAGDQSAQLLLTEAYELYRSLKAPEATELAQRLGLAADSVGQDGP